MHGSSSATAPGPRTATPLSGKPPRPGRKKASGGGPRKSLWIAMSVLALAATAVVVVYVWYLPSRVSESTSDTTTATEASQAPTTLLDESYGDADDIAQSLIRRAMATMETAYLDLQTFVPEQLTPEVLAAVEPSLTFIPSSDPSVFSAATAEAEADTVDYAGSETSYALGTLSATGTVFGVMVSKEEGSTEYYIDGEPLDWETTPTSATATTTAGTPTSSTPTDETAETALYQDYELGCSFVHPITWAGYSIEQLGVQPLGSAMPRLAIADPLDPVVQSTGTPTDFMVFFGAVASGTSSDAARSFIDSLVTNIGDAYPTMTMSPYESITDFQVNEIPATSCAFRARKNGDTRTLIWKYVALYFGGNVFAFCFGSDESQWDDNLSVFDATLDSFQMTLMPPPLAP